MPSPNAKPPTTTGPVPSEAFSSETATLSLRAPDATDKTHPLNILCVYKWMACNSYVQIAEETGLCRQTVAKIIGQPWAKAILAKESKRLAKPILEGLRALGPKALEVLGEILNDEKVPYMVRLSAVREVFDRGEGKAISRSQIEVTQNKPDSIAAIEKEMAELHHQMDNRLGVRQADAILINDR